jgi:hypothetical protein
MNDQDLTKTDYDPDVHWSCRGSLSFPNKFTTKFSIVSNKLNAQDIMENVPKTSICQLSQQINLSVGTTD